MKYEVDETSGSAVRPRAGEKFGAGLSEADKQEMQKRMEAAATPGPAHKALDALVGNWKAEVTCWEPGGSPKVSQGTAKTSWTLKGHFLEEEFQGEMMGKPFTGRSILGYDNVKQVYNSVWISDMQTSIFTSEGKGESGNKVITLLGKTTCAATGQKDVPVKSVFRLISPDKHVFEMYDQRTGKDEKTMEITYTKK